LAQAPFGFSSIAAQPAVEDSILYKIGAFAFWTWDSDFHRHTTGKAFDVAADEATPAQRFDLLEFRDDPEGVGCAFADHVEGRAKAF
jgi:hypothetical protein